ERAKRVADRRAEWCREEPGRRLGRKPLLDEPAGERLGAEALPNLARFPGGTGVGAELPKPARFADPARLIYDEADLRQGRLMRSLVWSGVRGVCVGGWCGWRWFHSSIRPRSGQGVGAERPGTRSTSRPAGGGQSQSRVRPGSRCFEAADLAVAKAVVT